MPVITSEAFAAQRERAKAFDRYAEAESCVRDLTPIHKLQLLAMPIVVGKVAFKQLDGSTSTLPLYLLRHKGHATFDYAHGYEGENLRLDCHCGHRHFFPRLQYPLRQVPMLLRAAIAIRKSRKLTRVA